MAAISSKFHIKIGDFGFLLAKQPRVERHIYERQEAPSFVNKFSSGEPSYRDSTFFPHWVQLNWQNGFNQEFFDDGGKFYRSSGLDPTEVTKLTIQKAFNSAGQVVSGATINCAVALIATTASAGWANNNYDYRKQITIVAPSGQNLPTGFPIKITEDTAALVTAGKMQADRDDWRVQYYNGTSWNDLSRDYVAASETWFGLQSQISGGATSTDYYVYYGYAAEATSKQPTTNDTWNAVYGAPPKESDTVGLWHFKENSGTTAADTSGNGNTITLGSGTWSSGGKFGYGMAVNVPSTIPTANDSASLSFSTALTFEMWVKFNGLPTAGTNHHFTSQDNGGTFRFEIYNNSGTYQLRLVISRTGSPEETLLATWSTPVTGTWYHVAVSWSGSTKIATFYVNGSSIGNQTGTIVDSLHESSDPIHFGDGANLIFDSIKFSNTVKTSFPHALVTSDPTVTQGSEVARASAPTASAYLVLAGASNGKIYQWDGGTTWTEKHDTTNTSVNCAVIHTISGTQYAYFGSGDPAGLTDGNAKIHRTSDGAAYAVAATLTGDATAAVTAIQIFNGNIYAGITPKAKVYKSTDGTTFTLSKDIDEPDNPGWIWAMEVYSNKLYVGGGHPQKFKASNSAGFLWSYDDFEWKFVGNFDFTVIRSLKVYDSLLFIGTINKKLYVFNTASIDKLLEFPWDVSIQAMDTWNDKLVLALSPTDDNNPSGQESVYLFDRNGFHNAFDTSNATKFTSLLSINNQLLVGTGVSGYVYKTVETQYQTSGTLQTSYAEASLPNIYKLYRSVTLMYDSLPTGCTILVEYKTDESDSSWTSLGTASTVGSTSATFNFASGIYSFKISFRVTLSTTNVSVTPTLRKIILKYVLSPDFKYLWKIKLLCADRVSWIDGTEPQAILGAAVSAGATSITLKSTDDATPTSGFPDPNGSAQYCTIEDSSGTKDVFTYTGKTSTTLTGIPATGANALGSHSVDEIVRITGANLHQQILDLKQTRQLFTFTDIDSLTYTVLFHSYQADNWVVNQDDYWGGLENEVPITLLEA